MIDTEFIIKYTNALYSTPVEFAPRYDEFRDMFSSGQLHSKEWLVKELTRKGPWDYRNKSIVIAGSWYGTLGTMLLSEIEDAKVTFLDIDPRCEKYLHNIFWNEPRAKIVTDDMYKYEYTEDIIINTSCEHIPDLRAWLDLIPQGRFVVLQSNDFDELPEHINCVHSVAEFAGKAKLRELRTVGEMKTNTYTRYMITGTT